MRAVIQDRYGPLEHLRVEDVDEPRPAPGGVLVRVHAASIHPDVWHVVRGEPRLLRLMGNGVRRPKLRIPGTDLAGVVEELGKGTTGFEVGDRVFGETAPLAWANGGAFAELAASATDKLCRMPNGISFEEAACLPTAGIITLQSLGRGVRFEGRNVLINGAGGGVGSLALQIALAGGARVTAVDTTSKLDFLRELGADEVVDFNETDILSLERRFDLFVDIPATRPFRKLKRLLKPEGRYVPIGHEGFSSQQAWFGLVPHFLGFVVRARFSKQLQGGSEVERLTPREAMVEVRRLAEAGVVRPPIARTYPLEDVVPALRLLTEGSPEGRIVLVP